MRLKRPNVKKSIIYFKNPRVTGMRETHYSVLEFFNKHIHWSVILVYLMISDFHISRHQFGANKEENHK